MSYRKARVVTVIVLAAGAGALLLLGAAQTSAGNRPVWRGTVTVPQGIPLPPAVTGRATEQLFQGDMTAEIGLGCSNSTGTSGGPNDWAVKVTASLAPPFGVISTTYNVFTNVSPGLTAFAFQAWQGGATPGTLIGGQALGAAGASQGNHTVAISPAIGVSAAQFYFGFNQGQTNAAMRLGEDTSSGSLGTSFIRAPGCGLTAWGTVDSIGYGGNWVMRAVIDDTVPVELMNYTAE